MENLHFEILTPSRIVYSGDVSEVVLPAYDGEVGVLPEHADFVGALGTGPLKIVKGGEDHWFMVSDGLYQVQDGKLTIFTQSAEGAADVNVDAAQAHLEELENSLKTPQNLPMEELPKLQAQRVKEAARVEVYRRTNLVN